MKGTIGGLLVASVLAGGCGFGTGPSCLARQKRGTVATVTGEVGAGQTTMHRVPYGTEGSQNDVDIRWPGQGPDGPQISVHATRVGCEGFMSPGSGVCSEIGSRGGYSPSGTGRDFVQTSLIVSSGRGNPDILGTPAEYKLWVVGDPARSAQYTMTITWFYGPDC